MSQDLIVAKFGGSSVRDAGAMRNCAKLAIQRKAHFIVTSATQGTTDQLVSLCDLEGNWKSAQAIVKSIETRHLTIAEELQSSAEVQKRVQKYCDNLRSLAHGIYLLKDCSQKTRHRILCLGELLASTLLVETFCNEGVDARFVDARKILRTNDRYGRALPQISRTAELCKENVILDAKTFLITQGFIGSCESGSVTTLGRGGSDYSAALFAEALGAKHLEIWTDVSGVATTDPRICPEARPIKEMSFREASELAAFGAKVLHPTTVWPSMRKGFPIFVGNTRAPEEGGTWIRSEVKDCPLIRAISLKNSQSFLTISTPEMSQSYGFLAKVFDVFNKHELSIDTVTTSEISIGVTIDECELLDGGLVQELRTFGSVDIENNLSLVSIVGNGIRHTPGLLEKVLKAINGINLRSICGGASKHQMCFLVDSNQAAECVQNIHRSFVS